MRLVDDLTHADRLSPQSWACSFRRDKPVLVPSDPAVVVAALVAARAEVLLKSRVIVVDDAVALYAAAGPCAFSDMPPIQPLAAGDQGIFVETIRPVPWPGFPPRVGWLFRALSPETTLAAVAGAGVDEIPRLASGL